jgi:hypothetical protein
LQSAVAALLHEHDFPVVEANAQHVAVVAEVEEELSGALFHLAGEVRQQVEPVDVVLELPSDRLVAAFLELFADVRVPCHREESRQPIVVLDNPVRHRASLDLARPAHQQWHAERAFPVRVLLASERRRAGIGPGIHVRAIVGRIHHEGVVGDSELVQ